MASPNDSRLVVTFRLHPMLNESKSKDEGRPVFDDVEVCEIRMAGDRLNIPVFPAHAEAPNGIEDPETGLTRPCTYAEKYAEQYEQFKRGEAQTKSGTPIEYLPFLSPSKVKELKAVGIYTAEALADLDGQPLKTLGMHGREWKTQAQAYLDNASGSAKSTALALENEQLRQQLEEMRKERSQYTKPMSLDVQDDTVPTVAGVSQFKDWEDSRIREWIKEKTGAAPRGNLSHDRLVEMADEIAQ